jgi:AraC family transcriptional regulator, regulatory protein of adaptative response / methylated-DNA-[protein]-cysteine methyltransferase
MARPSMVTEIAAGTPVGSVGAEEAWAAVRARDADYDGRFLYAVVTTGVYCRPGCASRTPRRENVRFFGIAADAAAAGFRPCKRCRPDGDRPSAAQRSVQRAREYLDAHLDERVTLERLAGVAHMSPHHLQRTFKRHVGLTPLAYVHARRAERLRRRLRQGDTVSRATFEAGYGSPSRVYEQVGTRLGMTPATYRRGGHGMEIRYATAAAPLGRVLVAATERGLCAVSLGDDDAALVDDLRREYPRATITPAADALQQSLEAILVYLDGSAPLPAMPLDVQASVFQQRVWQALLAIPYGARRSYRDIAAAIGEPRAVRAVARAIASNRVALVIPCHRVIRQNGELSGYRWGQQHKARLLEMEAVRKERPAPDTL